MLSWNQFSINRDKSVIMLQYILVILGCERHQALWWHSHGWLWIAERRGWCRGDAGQWSVDLGEQFEEDYREHQYFDVCYDPLFGCNTCHSFEWSNNFYLLYLGVCLFLGSNWIIYGWISKPLLKDDVNGDKWIKVEQLFPRYFRSARNVCQLCGMWSETPSTQNSFYIVFCASFWKPGSSHSLKSILLLLQLWHFQCMVYLTGWRYQFQQGELNQRSPEFYYSYFLVDFMCRFGI